VVVTAVETAVGMAAEAMAEAATAEAMAEAATAEAMAVEQSVCVEIRSLR